MQERWGRQERCVVQEGWGRQERCGVQEGWGRQERCGVQALSCSDSVMEIGT